MRPLRPEWCETVNFLIFRTTPEFHRRLRRSCIGSHTHELSYFGRSQFVIGHKPVGHATRCFAKRIIERPAHAHRHDFVGSLQARSGRALTRDHVHRELDVHSSFESIAIKFAVALQGVCISEIQQCARIGHRKVTVVPSPISLKSMLPP